MSFVNAPQRCNVSNVIGKPSGQRVARPCLHSTHRCHAREWNDAVIFAATTRAVRFVRIGLRSDADNLAELLALRDRDDDDRHLCVECRHGRATRCPDGLPMPLDTLHRCGAFTKDTT